MTALMKYAMMDVDANQSQSILNDTTSNYYSDSSVGCRLLAMSRWLELTQAERSKDPKHNAMVDRLYDGKPVCMDDMKNYDIWNVPMLEQDDKEEMCLWLNSPVICKTNQECHSLNYLRAKEYANAKNTVLIKWKAEHTKWEGKPLSYANIERAKLDPAFFEYFVTDGNITLTDTICKEKLLCNGTHAKYHSLVLKHKEKEWLEEIIDRSQAGDEIMLHEPPIAINILIENPKIIENERVNWQQVLLEINKVVITIRRYSNNEISARASIIKAVPIHSQSLLCTLSMVAIVPNFPLQPAFAITVEKAQGQTLDRVIIAMSECDLSITNFKYSCLYIAMSCVREATA